MTWGWTYYQGLSVNPTAGVSTQLLIKKYYTGYEMQPAVSSAWSGVKKVGPKPNLAALEWLMDAFYDTKDVLPMAENFWGTLAKVVLLAAGELIGSLASKSKSPKKKAKAPAVPKSLPSGNPDDPVVTYVKTKPKKPSQVTQRIRQLERQFSGVSLGPNRQGARTRNTQGRSRSRGRSTSRPRFSSRKRSTSRGGQRRVRRRSVVD